jgi:hypothetical protein
MKLRLLEGTGFTLLLDPVIEEFGLTGAAVFGSVYRHSLMRNEICYASQETIAKKVHVSRDTANKYLQELVKSDYLRIGKNDIPNFTNLYFPTGKAGIEADITIRAFKHDDPKDYVKPDESFDI